MWLWFLSRSFKSQLLKKNLLLLLSALWDRLTRNIAECISDFSGWKCEIYLIHYHSTASSNEGCVEKLFSMWDNVSLLSHRHHSDWVRNNILIHAPGNSSSHLFFFLPVLAELVSTRLLRCEHLFIFPQINTFPSHKVLNKEDFHQLQMWFPTRGRNGKMWSSQRKLSKEKWSYGKERLYPHYVCGFRWEINIGLPTTSYKRPQKSSPQIQNCWSHDGWLL